MSYKKQTIDSQEELSSRFISSYSCGNCEDTIIISHREELLPGSIICPNTFCGEREKFTLLKMEKNVVDKNKSR